MNKVNKALSAYFEAFVFATEAHGSQMYDTDKPYIFHLANVNQTPHRG
jgi:(p)ppGpp synthase/HD superfamily hydrolase